MRRRDYLKIGGGAVALAGGGYFVGAGGELPDGLNSAASEFTYTPFETVTWTETGNLEFTLKEDHGTDRYLIRHKLSERGTHFAIGHTPEFGGTVTVDVVQAANRWSTDYPSPEFKLDLRDGLVDPTYYTTSITAPDDVWKQIK